MARILSECGYEVETNRHVDTARGSANIDVWANERSSPPNLIVAECKHWKRRVSQTVVHAFRAVVGDNGANPGLLVSSAGFQPGAVDAARYSNVRLLDWVEFQQPFVVRWYREFMAPRLWEEAGPLIEYTEPISSRISRKASLLDDRRRDNFEAIRQKYSGLGVGSVAMYVDVPPLTSPEVPDLPLRESMTEGFAAEFPQPVVDATALRPLMTELIKAYRQAIAEFDDVFGERA